jgi:hypothetical protein
MQQDGVTHTPLEQTLPDGQWLSLQHSLQALLQHRCPAGQQVPLQHARPCSQHAVLSQHAVVPWQHNAPHVAPDWYTHVPHTHSSHGPHAEAQAEDTHVPLTQH